MKLRQTRPVYYVNTDTFLIGENKFNKNFKVVSNFITNKVKLKTPPTIVGMRKGRVVGTYRSSLTTLSQLKILNNHLLLQRH